MIKKIKSFFNNKEDSEMQYYIAQMQILKLANLRLKELYEQNMKYDIRKDIVQIVKISQKIFNELVDNKKKIVKMNLYIEYYIQDVVKILENYFKLKSFNDTESVKTCKTIEGFMKCIVIAFENIYKNLIDYSKTDMEVDIQIMLDELKNNFKEEKND